MAWFEIIQIDLQRTGILMSTPTFLRVLSSSHLNFVVEKFYLVTFTTSISVFLCISLAVNLILFIDIKHVGESSKRL